jgi:hypothetical protein
MPKLTNCVPKYRHHKRSGQAVVTLRGKDVYLGPYNSKASKLEYDRAIAEWLAAGRPTTPVQESCEVTVTELILGGWRETFGQQFAGTRRPIATHKSKISINTTVSGSST